MTLALYETFKLIINGQEAVGTETQRLRHHTNVCLLNRFTEHIQMEPCTYGRLYLLTARCCRIKCMKEAGRLCTSVCPNVSSLIN
jgi:hypothetical protein